jgi:F-type H+-transporting ATPase subunit a
MEHNEEHLFSWLPALHLPGLTPDQALVVEYTWLSMLVIIALLVAVILTLKKVPGGWQNVIELLISFVENYITDIMGPRGLRYFPLVVTVMLFILVAN